jgi:hypothetical protein
MTTRKPQEEVAPRKLGRDDILNAVDIELVEINVPEWGGLVTIKPMNVAQRDAFEINVSDKDGEVQRKNFRAKLVIRTVVDPESHTRIFKDEDIPALNAKSAAAVSRVFEAAARASGLSPEDVEKLEGNSNGQADDSSSD